MDDAKLTHDELQLLHEAEQFIEKLTPVLVHRLRFMVDSITESGDKPKESQIKQLRKLLIEAERVTLPIE